MKCEHCKDTTCSKRKTAGECTRYGTSNIEIPFGAFDSELGGFEYTIPEGFNAEIKDGKVIVKKSESEDADNAARDYADDCKLDNDTHFMERQLCVEHFKAGAQWEKEKFIKKACEWWEKNDSYAVPTNVQIERFKQAMEQ